MRLAWPNVTQPAHGITKTNTWLGSEICLLGTLLPFSLPGMEEELQDKETGYGEGSGVVATIDRTNKASKDVYSTNQGAVLVWAQIIQLEENRPSLLASRH